MDYIIILLLVLAVLGILLFAHKMAQKDKHNRKLKKQAKAIGLKADDIFDVAEQARNYIHAPDIITALIDYYIYLLKRREEIVEHADYESRVNEAETFKTSSQESKAVPHLNNDREINLAKRTFSRVSKSLRAALEKKLITGQACVTMRQALRFRLLTLEVDAYERLGDAAGERNDPAMATNYYKYAKKLLIESDLKFEGKNEHVREITQKTQALFGAAVEDKLSKQLKEEETTVDEHGIPKDLNAMSGQKKKF